MPARELDEHRRDEHERAQAVQAPVLLEARPAGAAHEHDEQRRGQDRGDEDDGLRAAEERERRKTEQEQHARKRRPLEHEHERESRGQEQRIERVLGHHRPRVEHRGEQHAEPGRHEGERLGEHAPGKQVRRNRRERHHDGVDDLGHRVRVGNMREDRPGRADQNRVHGRQRNPAVVAHEQRPMGREALGRLRVDELVGEDERRGQPPAEQVVEDRRGDDDPADPGPGGNAHRRADRAVLSCADGHGRILGFRT